MDVKQHVYYNFTSSQPTDAGFRVSRVHEENKRFKTCKTVQRNRELGIVQELCESRGGRPGLSVLTSLLVSVDVKQY